MRKLMIVDEFRNRETHVKSGPAVLGVESVAGCPFSCAMCKAMPTKPRRISPALLKRIEPAFAGLEVLLIDEYGEPLLADLHYFVNQSMKCDFVLNMNTTGSLLTDEITELLVKTRLSIRFSVHAGRPETYYRIVGGDLLKVKQQISHLIKTSKKSEKKDDFWFSFIVMKENINEIEEFLQLACDCGIRSVRFMRLKPNSDTLKGLTVRGFTFKYSEQSNNQVLHSFLSRLPRYEAIAAKLGIKIERGDATNGAVYVSRFGEMANIVTNRLLGKRLFPLMQAEGLCVAPWIGQLIVSTNGDVRLCCASPYRLGNLNESSLDDIWHGQKMTIIRATFKEGRYPRVCGYCRGFGFSNYPNNSFPGVER